MAYFPFFVSLEGRRGLIIGGGTVALRKAEQLLPFRPELTVVSETFLPAFSSLPGIRTISGSFREALLEGKSFVIAATNQPSVNREAAALCQTRGIPVNVVDDPEACTFYFPALICDGPLCIGISTGGTSPTAAAHLRRSLQAQLPPRLGEILDSLGALRPALRSVFPVEKRRALYAALFAACLEKGGPLEPEEQDVILSSFQAEGGQV